MINSALVPLFLLFCSRFLYIAVARKGFITLSGSFCSPLLFAAASEGAGLPYASFRREDLPVSDLSSGISHSLSSSVSRMCLSAHSVHHGQKRLQQPHLLSSAKRRRSHSHCAVTHTALWLLRLLVLLLHIVGGTLPPFSLQHLQQPQQKHMMVVPPISTTPPTHIRIIANSADTAQYKDIRSMHTWARFAGGHSTHRCTG